ncbi:MAG: hypothetical protein LBM92_07715, partial [Opitutaceae bacterium]|nr:hypothetical protein [Opitutaceae bacterium]
MKKFIPLLPLLPLLALLFSTTPAAAAENEAAQTMRRLWKTSPFLLDDGRAGLLKTIQQYSEKLPHPLFKEYLAGSEQTAAAMERAHPILHCYRAAFERVADEVASTRVKRGSAAVWLLYNMGVVVKTPSGCFGVDINHRHAEKLAPLLDFLCVTHNHGDHKSPELAAAMRALGKPVLSNFIQTDPEHCSKTPASYKIGAFSIRTAIADHNEKLPDFITVFRVECGPDSGDFSLLHCGDANFTPSQFIPVQGPVSLLLLRFGAPEDNNILDAPPGAGQIRPGCAALSHLIELRHDIEKSPRRRTLGYGMENTAKIHCSPTILPFWGEKMIWENGKPRAAPATRNYERATAALVPENPRRMRARHELTGEELDALFAKLPLFLGLGSPNPRSKAQTSSSEPASSFDPRGTLNLAVALQKIGRDAALEKLRAWAKQPGARNVIPLCRMLFVARPGGVFRAPMIGGQLPWPGSDKSRDGRTDWPLLPIALSDGIPFLVTWGLLPGGTPETAAHYIDYCAAGCDWNPRRYSSLVNQKALEAACASLLLRAAAPGEWFDRNQIAFFTEQLKYSSRHPDPPPMLFALSPAGHPGTSPENVEHSGDFSTRRAALRKFLDGSFDGKSLVSQHEEDFYEILG